jgi:hypothetical protein
MRLLVSLASILAILVLAPQSQGWWLFHHPHHPHIHNRAMVAGPVASPLTVGFQIPGGYGIQVSTQQPLFQHQGTTQAPSQVQIDSSVTGTIDRVVTSTNAAADKLDQLISRINSNDDKAKLRILERSGQKATGSSSDAPPPLPGSKAVQDKAPGT